MIWPKLKSLIERKPKLFLTIGVLAIVGGIALAYFTGDADPWGTLGGVFAALGLLLGIAGWSTKKA